MADEFWFNITTHEVEEGKQSPAVDRAGPYATRAEAEQALARIRSRNEAWDAEDAEDR